MPPKTQKRSKVFILKTKIGACVISGLGTFKIIDKNELKTGFSGLRRIGRKLYKIEILKHLESDHMIRRHAPFCNARLFSDRDHYGDRCDLSRGHSGNHKSGISDGEVFSEWSD